MGAAQISIGLLVIERYFIPKLNLTIIYTNINKSIIGYFANTVRKYIKHLYLYIVRVPKRGIRKLRGKGRYYKNVN